MLRSHYPLTNLFAECPTLGLALDPMLAYLDRLLDDDVLNSTGILHHELVLATVGHGD